MKMETKNKLPRVITAEDIRMVKERGRLVSMAIRLPGSCNLRCSYCYGCAERKGNLLTFAEVRNVLKQGAELGARTVSVVGEGEPLLYPRFREFIESVDDLGMIPTIYSNCTLVTPDIAQFLYEHNATMIGKQNVLSSEGQDEISGVEGAHDMMTRGLAILTYQGFASAAPSRLGVHSVVLKENLKDLPDMWRSWRRANILPQVQALVYPSKKQPAESFDYYKNHAPTPAETRRLFESLSKIDCEEFGINWNPLVAYPIAPDGCRVHCGSVGITQQGDVQICNYTEDSLGNIREKRLAEILASDKVRRVRCVGETLNYPGQRYGCRAHAFNVTGDRFGKDPFYDRFLEAV
jgi:MoaA/NifB/PqqE/SkfB family radical SAM enzyme